MGHGHTVVHTVFAFNESHFVLFMISSHTPNERTKVRLGIRILQKVIEGSAFLLGSTSLRIMVDCIVRVLTVFLFLLS